MNNMRLDVFLFEKGYFNSRQKAQNAIKDGAISVNGKVINKANYECSEFDIIEVLKETNLYVSRGGYKLEAAIKDFYLDFKDKIILDIGSSTGGFTDCAIKHGAKLVYALDVGTDQLDESLKNRSDVISMEQTNILDVDSFPTNIDFIVMDVSFVSISKILPAIDRFLNNDNAFVCLVKPQFEVGKRFLKNGIVKDRTMHIKVLEAVKNQLESYGMGIEKMTVSPILGGSGNKEFLIYVKRNIKSKVNIIEVCK